MCGIFGVVEAAGSLADPALAAAALRILHHRGPDDAGVLGWCGSGEVAVQTDPAALRPARCLLAHRRLSILDLSRAGWQPMMTPDGRYAIVFNGEIYNYRELGAELAALGVPIRSGSDTEVLLQGFARWGPDVLRRLAGMFSFAVLDRDARHLFLARDFFGIKPLYYARGEAGRFAFASEIKALLPLPWVRSAADPARLLRFLVDGGTDDADRTLFADVRQLPPAHWMIVPLDGGAATEPVRYWSLDLDRTTDLSFAQASERLRETFLESIRLHLRSDVPVGAALSGGIDSSAIVAAVRTLHPEQEIHAFSFVAEDPAVCEEKWVDVVHRDTGAMVHKVRPAPGDLAADLDRLIATQDEPFATTSIYAQFRVFQRAREHGITVMLDGQGADELLAGYWPFILSRFGSLVHDGRLGKAAGLLRRAARLSHVPTRSLLASAAGLTVPPALRAALRRRRDGSAGSPDWLRAGWFHERGASLDARSVPRSGRMLRESLLHSVETALPALLRFEDRNSMAHSIESRVPFLTPAVAELAFSLPEEFVLGGDGSGKRVFRSAMRGIVPDAILDRRDKIGFATPERAWLRALAPWVEGVLGSEAAHDIPVFDAAAAGREWQAVMRGERPFGSRVWRWINLVRWAEIREVEFA
jgi:asparagine synthase (glutamine-hydrolysing)